MENPARSKSKTPDGRRLSVRDLNTEVPPLLARSKRGVWARIAQAYRNLSMVMAGMYTGLNCYGTPKEEHSYGEPSADKPDRRPL